MPHRLWFRLEHVLPLAEHAMACFDHRITRAQILAGAASGPALVWTNTPMRDVLTSNGLPGWYGEGGTRHAAEAFAWRDACAGYGTAWTGDDTTAYLPLTLGDDSPGPVVALLRVARITGNRWVTVDIDPADKQLIGTHRVHAVAGRHDLVPAGTRWIPAPVTCRDVAERPYPALVADGYTSDSGALLARFDKPTIQRMAADLDAVHGNPDSNSDPMPGEYPKLALRGAELFVLDDKDHHGELTWHTTDRLTPDADGYYPLGAYLWNWQLVSTSRG
jgi:hypothetical protein